MTSILDGPLSDYTWVLILGFIVAFFLAFSVGANDVANPFGTSVGSGALTLLQVCICATFMETLGAMTLGGAVSDTIRRGIVEPKLYADKVPQLMIGQACAMLGAACWQILASVMKMPVSGTHSIVGAVLGFALVAQGGTGINWNTIIKIISSWFISPLFAGGMAVGMYTFLKKLVLMKIDKERRALIILPFMYASVIFLNLFSVLYTGSRIYQIDFLKTWHMLVISCGLSLVVWAMCQFVFRPKQMVVLKRISDGKYEKNDGCLSRFEKRIGWDQETRKRKKQEKAEKKAVEEEQFIIPTGEHRGRSVSESSAGKPGRKMSRNSILKTSFSGSTNSIASRISSVSNSSKRSIYGVIQSDVQIESLSLEPAESLRDGSEDQNMRYLFSQLQAFSACLDAFAHGGNDVGNSIGPVLALWSLYRTGDVSLSDPPSPWIIGYGCIGIILGLWILGRRVIETVGEDIAEITPARGFSIDLMAGLTVLLGSNFGIPLSTTHCKVGAVISVSLMHNSRAVSWRTFGNIAWAWIVTLPVSAGISAFCYWAITKLLLNEEAITVTMAGYNSTSPTVVAAA